jgi:hypothetical protein
MIAASIQYYISDQKTASCIHLAQLIDVDTFQEAIEWIAKMMAIHFTGIPYTINLCNGPEIMKQELIQTQYPYILTYNN